MFNYENNKRSGTNFRVGASAEAGSQCLVVGQLEVATFLEYSKCFLEKEKTGRMFRKLRIKTASEAGHLVCLSQARKL